MVVFNWLRIKQTNITAYQPTSRRPLARGARRACSARGRRAAWEARARPTRAPRTPRPTTGWYWNNEYRSVYITMTHILTGPVKPSDRHRGTTCDCKRDRLWVRSHSIQFQTVWSSKWNIYIKLIFSFLRFGVKAKPGVEFRHSTLGSLCLHCCVRDAPWNWFHLK